MAAWTWVRHARVLSPFYWRRRDRAPPDHFRLTLPPLWDEPDPEGEVPAARDAASKETNARDATALLEGPGLAGRTPRLRVAYRPAQPRYPPRP
jgi:hypothetical protein